jgi:3-methyladenine DNA glycosylase/8-oxoguanine DNA glycosylase
MAKANVIRCVYDNSACIKLDEEDFRCCFSAGRDGRIKRMCRKFKESKDYSNRKELVRKAVENYFEE